MDTTPTRAPTTQSLTDRLALSSFRDARQVPVCSAITPPVAYPIAAVVEEAVVLRVPASDRLLKQDVASLRA